MRSGRSNVSRPRLHGVGRGRARALLACALGLALGAACAAPGDDVHLPPLVSDLARAGGGREFEALFGIVSVRRPGPEDVGAPHRDWALRPLVSHVAGPGDRSLTHFLAPLGRHERRPDGTTSWLAPLYWFVSNDPELAGSRWNWRFLLLPGLLLGQHPDGHTRLGLFPIGGVAEQFLTWDRLTWVLFPLFAKTTKHGGASWHFLWPLFNVGRSGLGGGTFRILPLYGHSIRPDRFVKRTVLWPFVHWSSEGQHLPPQLRTHRWMLWPLVGRLQRGSFRSWTFLWPFFGWSEDDETGYWAWDGPWPFVRVQGGGEDPTAEVRRYFWPFWSEYRGDGLESHWCPWPIVNWRHEVYEDGERDGFYVVPFWQSFHRTDEDGATRERWRKLWPLWQDHLEGDHRRWAFPALNPFWPTPVMDDHYAWIYELFAVETEGGVRRERSWGNLWHREVDAFEDRAYLLGLWSRRRYGAPGARTSETSLLFGLLRWRRTPDEGIDWLRPAFPGPGWPARRTAAGAGPDEPLTP